MRLFGKKKLNQWQRGSPPHPGAARGMCRPECAAALRSAPVLGVTALCLGLSGCGGGGAGSDSSPPSDPTPPEEQDAPSDQPEPPADDPDPQPELDPQPDPTPQPQPQPAPAPPQPTPDPTPPPDPPPDPTPQPQPDPACLATADFGCLNPVEYRQRRDGLAQGFRNEEAFGNQWGLATIRADVAYAELALRYGQSTRPGQGQTIGVIDTGIDRDHPVFASKTVFEQFLSGAADETGDGISHGTAVASVIAGDPFAPHVHDVQAAQGVAPGADLAMFAIPLGSGGGLYRPVSLAALNRADSSSATLFNTVTGWSRAGSRLDFVNMSFGYSGLIEQYGAQELRTNFGRTIAALAQAGGAEKTVFIISAGNGHGALCDTSDFAHHPHLCRTGRVDARSASVLAGLPARIPELRGHVIAVAAVAPDTDGDGNYGIASFSNRCGIAAQWCIAAPGQQIRAAYFGPHPNDGTVVARGAYSPSGTSFAAPMVTGSLAIMKHAFRDQLSNRELVTRLLTTANNRGLYSDSSIYGRGLLDLGAALTPVGPASVALGGHVEAPGIALAQTLFQPGRALGNGLARGLSGQEIVVFDTLGAPFWLPLDTLVGQAARPSAETRLRALMTGGAIPQTFRPLRPDIAVLRKSESIGGAGWYLGQLQSARGGVGFGGGHLSLADRALTLGLRGSPAFDIAAFSTEGTRRLAPISGTIVFWRPESLPFGFRTGLAAERRTILGSRLGGAFGAASARSLFAGIDWRGQAEGWKFQAAAEIGRADAGARGGLVEHLSPLISSAFALRAHRILGKGTLSFALAQPLRVESGKARLSVPVGRSTDGRLLRRSVSAGLAPDGRQIDVSAHWSRSFGHGRDLRLGATWTRHPGHDAGAKPELTTLAKWRIRF